MKKSLLLVFIMITSLLFSVSRLSAQSDKEIIKTAQKKLTAKAYDTAFSTILTVKNIKNKNAQAIIKKAFPGLINKNNMKANAVKIAETDDNKTKIEKYEKILGYYSENAKQDELLKANVKPEVYKALSKKKRNDGLLNANSTKLTKIKDAMALEEQRIQREKDSLASIEKAKQDSIAALAKPAETTTTVTQKNTPTSTNTNIVVSTKPASTFTASSTATGVKKYYIIAGSYPTKEGAQAAVDKLKTDGFSSSEIVGLNALGNLRICFASYSTMTEAAKELETIRAKTLPDAWILEQ